MKLRRVFHKAQASQAYPLRLLTLCLFFAVGIVAGQILQRAVPGETGSELEAYLRGYVSAAAEETQVSALQVLAVYLRAPLLLCLLGFCTFGAAVIPLVCALQGFTLSFAVACFAGNLGQKGLLLSLAVFGLRSVVALPCTLLIAQWAFDRALRRMRGETPVRTPTVRRRLLGCFFALLLGGILEITVVPRLFSAVLGG